VRGAIHHKKIFCRKLTLKKKTLLYGVDVMCFSAAEWRMKRTSHKCHAMRSLRCHLLPWPLLLATTMHSCHVDASTEVITECTPDDVSQRQFVKY